MISKLPGGFIKAGGLSAFFLMIGEMESFKILPGTTTNSYSYLKCKSISFKLIFYATHRSDDTATATPILTFRYCR